MSVATHCEREVLELHQFFQDWFNGAVPENDSTFARLGDVLAADFQLVTPAGTTLPRERVLEMVRNSHPANLSAPGQSAVKIWIEACTIRVATADLILATYEEWQRRDGAPRGRQSTVIMRVREETPNGLEWVHLHETWINGT